MHSAGTGGLLRQAAEFYVEWGYSDENTRGDVQVSLEDWLEAAGPGPISGPAGPLNALFEELGRLNAMDEEPDPAAVREAFAKAVEREPVLRTWLSAFVREIVEKNGRERGKSVASWQEIPSRDDEGWETFYEACDEGLAKSPLLDEYAEGVDFTSRDLAEMETDPVLDFDAREVFQLAAEDGFGLEWTEREHGLGPWRPSSHSLRMHTDGYFNTRDGRNWVKGIVSPVFEAIGRMNGYSVQSLKPAEQGGVLLEIRHTAEPRRCSFLRVEDFDGSGRELALSLTASGPAIPVPTDVNDAWLVRKIEESLVMPTPVEESGLAPA